MDAIVFICVGILFFLLLACCFFIWATKNNQFQSLDQEALRIMHDDEPFIHFQAEGSKDEK